MKLNNLSTGILIIALLCGIVTAATTISDTEISVDTIKTDIIYEKTAFTGTTINGVLNKDYIVIESPSGYTAITAADGITVTRKIMRVVGDGGAVDITADPQIADGVAGQIVIIQGIHDTSTLKLDNGAGLALSASITLAQYDSITLMYEADEDIWIEISRTTVA